jgi:hypothetical protein
MVTTIDDWPRRTALGLLFKEVKKDDNGAARTDKNYSMNQGVEFNRKSAFDED